MITRGYCELSESESREMIEQFREYRYFNVILITIISLFSEDSNFILGEISILEFSNSFNVYSLYMYYLISAGYL